MKKNLLVLSAFALFGFATAQAQVQIHGNTLDGSISSASFYGTGAVNDSIIVGANIRKGSGLTAQTATGAFSTSAWSSTLSTADYVQIYMDFGTSTVDFSNIVYSATRSSSAISSVTVRTSADGYATDFASSASPTGGTISLASLADQTGSFGIRLYALGSNHSGQTWAVNDYAVNGTVIPEPSTYALLSGCLALGAVMLRRGR
jgi:hypothetical protein